jgi:hypothetical protein
MKATNIKEDGASEGCMQHELVLDGGSAESLQAPKIVENEQKKNK